MLGGCLGVARISGGSVFVDYTEDGVADMTIVVNGGTVACGDLLQRELFVA